MSQQKIYTKRKITYKMQESSWDVVCCLFYLSLPGEITALEIGAVYLNTNRDAPEMHNDILCRADFNFGNAMSLVIQPGGLSESRREYLYLFRETVCETRMLQSSHCWKSVEMYLRHQLHFKLTFTIWPSVWFRKMCITKQLKE